MADARNRRDADHGDLPGLLKKRLWRGAVVPAVIVGCLAGSWTLYASRHAATAEQRAQQDSYIVITNFGETFWQRQAGNPNAGQIGASELPARVWNNLTAMATHDVGVMVLAPLPYWKKEER